VLEQGDRLPGLCAQRAFDVRPVVLTRQQLLPDVADERLAQPDHGVRRYPRRDVILATRVSKNSRPLKKRPSLVRK
jgi:hypothetical protein